MVLWSIQLYSQSSWSHKNHLLGARDQTKGDSEERLIIEVPYYVWPICHPFT